MKKLILLCSFALLISSCEKKVDGPDGGTAPKNIEHFITSQEYTVPVKEGYVTQVNIGGKTVAEAVTPMTILLPKQTLSKVSSGPELVYVPTGEYPNELENKAKLYQVVCFEDSRAGDYDYNDLVIHVMYKVNGNRFGFGVQPIALGSTKAIKLGCVVYKGKTQIFKGLITPEGKNCREQYFESQEGFINTYGKAINQKNGGWPSYLGSTIRNWDITKYPGDGAMRVEWYIEVDNGTELYALSTSHLSQSFDKNQLPYGLVITNTGDEYIDDKGMLCGYDWFNYPQESQPISEVYPEIWEWLTSDKSFVFDEIYDGGNIPANAFPASDLGLFEAADANVCDAGYMNNK